MAKRTNEQRLRAAGVRPTYRDDVRALRRQADRDNHAAQVAIGHRFGLCAFARTIRSRPA